MVTNARLNFTKIALVATFGWALVANASNDCTTTNFQKIRSDIDLEINGLEDADLLGLGVKSLDPATVLPQICPHFESLAKQGPVPDGEFGGLLYQLPKIPHLALDFLTKNLPVEFDRVSYLSRHFWKVVQFLQSRKITVGIYSQRGSKDILGFYDRKNKILVTTPLFGNLVISHEARHSMQKDPASSDKCRYAWTRAYNEIDAIRAEMTLVPFLFQAATNEIESNENLSISGLYQYSQYIQSMRRYFYQSTAIMNASTCGQTVSRDGLDLKKQDPTIFGPLVKSFNELLKILATKQNASSTEDELKAAAEQLRQLRSSFGNLHSSSIARLDLYLKVRLVKGNP